MPYIEGETLRDRIEREGQLGVEEGAVWAPDGSAIYYISGQSFLKASVRTGSTFSGAEGSHGRRNNLV